MFGARVRPPIGYRFTSVYSSLFDSSSRRNHLRPQGLDAVWVKSASKLLSAIILSACFSLAFSGCGAGIHLANAAGTADGKSSAELSELSCGSSSMTGAGTDACTVTLNAAAPSGGMTVKLVADNAAVTLPASVSVPTNATSVGFKVAVSPVASAQTLTITASAGSVSETFTLTLSPSTSTLSVESSSSPSNYGSPVTFTATISQGLTGNVTFNDNNVSIGTAQITAGKATLETSSLAPGYHTITATWAGNSSDAALTSADITQVVVQATPLLTWATPAPISYGTPVSGTQLDASSPIPGKFSYTMAAGSLLSVGSYEITAYFTPNNTTDYEPAAATVTLNVKKAEPAISWAAPAAIFRGTALSATQLDATANLAGTFVYTPSAGTVLTPGLQTLSVTFTPNDTTDYKTATTTVPLTVKAGTPVIAWAPPAAITFGTALSATQLDASANMAGTFAYTPAAGTVLQGGTQTLSVTFTAENPAYGTATATVPITVSAGTSPITWLPPAAIPYGTALSRTQLNASTSVPGTFVYTPAAGTVLKAGLQTLSVTLTPTDASEYQTATATTQLSVTRAIPAIIWATPESIPYGTPLSSAQLDASSPVAGTFSYTVAAGTLLTAGSHQITVYFTPTDTTDYQSTQATVTLTVNQGTPVITWPTPAAINQGTALGATQLDASANMAGTFFYTPAAGAVLLPGLHPLSVTFTPADATDFNSATATVSLTVNATGKAAPSISWSTPAAINYGTALSTAQLDATATVAGTFVYSPAAGTVLKAGTQTLSVTFTPANSSEYSIVTGTVPLTVNQAKPAITWAAPAAMAYGTALSAAQLNATASVAGTFVYSPPAGTVLKPGSQTLSVMFVPTDSTDYTTATSSISVTVSQATPAITWATPAAITYGTAISSAQLDASSPVAGTFAYTPASGAILKAGSQTLSVTFTPTDSTAYQAATGSVVLTVNPSTPVITWVTPAAITQGTALGAAQLDASANVPGTFVYTPAAGTVLDAGLQTLSVTFTPTDATDYKSATATVALMVNSAAKITPPIYWSTPSPITYGTALSATQLNASSPVNGTFTYSPAAGTVLTAGLQTLSVTFTPNNTNKYSTATITVTLTVNPARPVITWVTPAAITQGTALGAAQLDASANVPGTFVYSPAAGTVLNTGLQTLSVTFTPTDATDYKSATATVALTVNAAAKTIPSIYWGTPSPITYGTALSATQLNANSPVNGTFTYSPAAGTVLTAGLQTLSVTFTPNNTNKYSNATSTVALTVNQARPVLTWVTPAAITQGTALGAAQLDASANVPGTFVYAPAAGTVLNTGLQTLSVTFTPTDATDYKSATATVALMVNSAAKITPPIYWGTPSPITYGTVLSATQLNANSPVNGTFAYSPAAGTVLTAGLQTLSVTFTPNNTNKYSTATGTVALTVNPATPVITWVTPASITQGTALGAAQLDASANVPGAFVYAPAAGTVLNAGLQTLSVTFTPTDSTDYKSATASVALTVNAAAKITPPLYWGTPSPITYGTALSATQLNASSPVNGTFTYSPAAGTVLTAGLQTLSVTFTPNNTNKYSTATSTVTFTVNPATPVITWATPTAITQGTALGAAQLDASANVPGTFAYAPAAGTVLNAGLQTLSVTFTPTDATDYKSATATVALMVNSAAKITPPIYWGTPSPITYGTALSATQLNASSPVNGTFTYSPAAGTVLTAGLQTLSVTFTPNNNNKYSTATGTVELTVNPATPLITWASPAAISYGTTLSATQLDATSTVAGTFAYTPAAGTVLKAGSQTLSVTFTPADSTDYKPATGSVLLTVNKATPVITWTTPAAITYGTALSGVQLDASSTVAGSFAYNPAAGTVLKAGTQTLSVTFTPSDAADYATATASATLTVNTPTQTEPAISWTAPAAITYGTALSTTQLDATATVAGAFAYTPAAGTVLKAGKQTLSVTFTPANTTLYSTATATVTLTVNQANPVIAWAAPAAITYGTALGSTQLDASSTVAGAFAYAPAAGTILKAGLQTLSVTLTPTDSIDYTTATSSVSVTVKQATPVITWAAPAAITYGTALGSTQLDASSTVAGSFAYSPAAGSVLNAGLQTLSVTFAPTDSSDYTTASATVILKVNAGSSLITWATPAAITYGTALSAEQLDATATVPGTFAYTPAAGFVLKAGSQTLSVTFTPANTSEYASATATVTLTVNKATPAIDWATPAAITYGTALGATQLDATSTTAGTFAYSPAAGSVLKAGSQTLSVTFTPIDSTDYTTATSSTSVTVNKATPAIDWATPAAIAYGTALGSAQLDASSSVPGSFVYSPAAGTVPAAGSQTLSVIFTPIDAADYTTATANVNLKVNAGSSLITWATPAAITYGTALGASQLDATATVPGKFVYTPAAGTVLKAGSQTLSVTFTPANSSDYATATATVTLTVSKATPAIAWAAPAAIAYGTALGATQLDATATVAGTFAYSPAAGTVLNAGSQALSVMFTPTDSTDYTTGTATVTLKVNAGGSLITWANPAAITYGNALGASQLDATAPVPGKFVYTPAAGTVLKAGSQTLSVTFTPANSSDYTTATATVTLTVNKAKPAIAWAAPAAITYGTALSTTQLDATSTVAGAFAYAPAVGTALKAGSQTLSVTFTPADATDFTTATSSTSVMVNRAAPAIAWATPSAITSGTALSATQLDATSTVAGSFAYTPAAGTVLTAGLQTLSVKLTPTDSTDYTTATATVTLKVKTPTQTKPAISWTVPAAITYGTALSSTQLDATSTVAGTFAYSPAAGAVLKAGSQTLSVTFTPANTTAYSTATATVSLTVDQAMPAITWATPAAITTGTALSSTQLDASSTVAGSFAYSPAAGTVLSAGSQTLSVTFTPADTTDYATATQTVKLAVNQAIATLSINATSVGFGDVLLSTPATQTITLTSTGTAPVTVNSAILVGIGFTMSGPTFPSTLAPGQSAILNLEFDPTVLGVAAGVLTITSTSSSNAAVAIALTGTGMPDTPGSYTVNLTWDAPSGSPVAVTGYNVYRSLNGTSTYQLLNSSSDAQTAYTDNTVQTGQTYQYIVESVDDTGAESSPSTPIVVTIP